MEDAYTVKGFGAAEFIQWLRHFRQNITHNFFSIHCSVYFVYDGFYIE